MSRQLRIDFPGAIHHITSRGNERRIIYRDDRDRIRFLKILEEVVSLRRWILHAWVLMSNHYHLLIETPEVGLSREMKRLNESYATWFNLRHRRAGHLFQGRFKNILIERESHLLELTRYIVLNPVRCHALKYAGDWRWSNYRKRRRD
ncbi:MAG: transposase [Acidobacteria bacterium]|nr:transposase [Acidobacteriota bacterium]